MKSCFFLGGGRGQVGNEVWRILHLSFILIPGYDKICQGVLKLEAKDCTKTIEKCIRRPAILKASQSVRPLILMLITVRASNPVNAPNYLLKLSLNLGWTYGRVHISLPIMGNSIDNKVFMVLVLWLWGREWHVDCIFHIVRDKKHFQENLQSKDRVSAHGTKLFYETTKP